MNLSSTWPLSDLSSILIPFNIQKNDFLQIGLIWISQKSLSGP